MQSRHSFLIQLVLLCMLVSACKPALPAATSTGLPATATLTATFLPEATDTPSPTPTPEPALPESTTLRIRFITSSDWTALFLLLMLGVMRDLVDRANGRLPFGYRIDDDGDVFTLVPTRTRDEQGRTVGLTPLLDRRVTIPLGRRRIFEHVNLLTQALEQQTGFRISCCRGIVAGIRWGSTIVSFEARDEPARSAFLRLVRSEPIRLDREEPGAYGPFRSDAQRYYWLMRCHPGLSWCFINVALTPDRP